MKRYIYLLFILTNCFLSCNNDDDENDCHPETILSNWNTQKEIVIEFDTEFNRNNYNIVDGNKLLFEYNHIGAQCDHIIDDEWQENLVFQIENTSVAFEYIDNDLLLTNCYYQQLGAWVNHNQYQVKNGTIKGEKLSENEWKIIVNVETTPLFENEQPKEIQFTQIFIQ
ncbi:hypothetical protein [Aestuariibaculum marinum]|uniref:Uncharacterized protein n=1 Tax=Aestuariibaculum marinum TaxID=2683592 RepID=A0A8J6Q7C7_9FLAO|nr:hypothetical protein [Aestuariibaculum marinum]MBD0824838.1 hypothetical protein [Aestuariibaculum marinum]